VCGGGPHTAQKAGSHTQPPEGLSRRLGRNLVGAAWNTSRVGQFWGVSATAWTGIYTIITFGLLVVAVVAALYAKKQWQIGREQAEDARTAQVEASRPYVVVAIEPSGASRHLFDLTVRNIGQRPALSVSIALDPPPVALVKRLVKKSPRPRCSTSRSR